MSILQEIFSHKRVEVEKSQRTKPLPVLRREAEAASPALDFITAINHGQTLALIAEIKRASPSKGEFWSISEPLQLAQVYTANGASAISILTDQRYFQGDLDNLIQARRKYSRMPLLRKDFFYHPYQVYEARAAGADAILLIAAYLEPAAMSDLLSLARALGMAALVEVHSLQEMESILPLQPRLVGLNNRDLHTFQVNLETTQKLARYAPREVTLVSESGIRNGSEAALLAQAGVDAILVGEALVTAADPAAKVRELSSVPKRADRTYQES